MNKEIAQKLIDKIGLEKVKDIIKNCPADCDIYRENIGSVVVFEISIGVLKTALMLLGHDQSQNNLDDWVNIKERLPKSYTNVLLYMIVPINDVPTQLISIGYIDDENYWRYADHFGGFSYSADNFDDEWASDFHSKWITHWQPLPNPPKQKEQQ